MTLWMFRGSKEPRPQLEKVVAHQTLNVSALASVSFSGSRVGAWPAWVMHRQEAEPLSPIGVGIHVARYENLGRLTTPGAPSNSLMSSSWGFLQSGTGVCVCVCFGSAFCYCELLCLMSWLSSITPAIVAV